MTATHFGTRIHDGNITYYDFYRWLYDVVHTRTGNKLHDQMWNTIGQYVSQDTTDEQNKAHIVSALHTHLKWCDEQEATYLTDTSHLLDVRQQKQDALRMLTLLLGDCVKSREEKQ